MIVREVRVRCRRGVAAVEAAFVMVLMTTFVFGIIEYCRLLMDMNLLNNAAREGCRYALTNNTNTTIVANVSGVVNSYMGSEAANFNGFTVTLSGTHNGVSTPVNSLSPGDSVSVRVTGTYKFMNIVPLVSMPTALPITSTVTMGCEGGT